MSFAVITRTHWLEGPYLNEFIAWYRHWGFNKIYFINTDIPNKQRLIDFIDPELMPFIDITDYNGKINSFPYARSLFQRMTEDYVLHVDTDEFLVLPNGYNNIDEFIKDNQYDIYQFHWVMLPVNKFIETSMLDYLYTPGTTYKPAAARKMMVRRQAWLDDPKSELSMHYIKCKGTKIAFTGHRYGKEVDGSEPFIIHFSVRGYLHTLFKIRHQKQLKSCQRDMHRFLKGESMYPDCPLRCRIAIADIYSSQKLVEVDKWNVTRDLKYKKCTMDDMLKLYGTVTDTNDLSSKFKTSIDFLEQHDIPVTIHAGVNYDNYCQTQIKKKLATSTQN